MSNYPNNSINGTKVNEKWESFGCNVNYSNILCLIVNNAFESIIIFSTNSPASGTMHIKKTASIDFIIRNEECNDQNQSKIKASR